MRHCDLRALVLHVRAYRETSGMVQFFTREQGRVVGVLKGMHRGRNPVVLQPFSVGRLSCAGRSGLMTVTQFDVDQRINLRGDALSAGFYVLELLSRSLAEWQIEAEIYDASVAVLEELQSVTSLAPLLRRFELVLLSQLGYALDYRHDAHSGALIDPDGCYECVPQTGFVQVAASAQAISGATLLAIDARSFDDADVLKAARRLNQLALRPLIGDAPLISRSMYAGGRHG